MIRMELNLSKNPFRDFKQIKYTKSEKTLLKNLKKENCYLKSYEFNHEKEWRGVFDTTRRFINFEFNSIKDVTLRHFFSKIYIEMK